MRLNPRYNPDVNQWWMCDAGRYGYKNIDEHRLTHVQLRDDAGSRQAGWEEALDRVAGVIVRLKDTHQLDRIGVILSTHLTNEDLYVAKRVFQVLGIANVTVQGPSKPGVSDNFLIKADKSPNTRGAQALGLSFESARLFERAARKELSVLYVVGHDVVEVYGQTVVNQAVLHLELFIFQGSNANASVPLAHVVLPSAVYAEKDGTFTNCQDRVQRIRQAFPPLGEAKYDWQILLELAKRMDVAIDFPNAQTVFQDLTAHEPAFQNLSDERIGDHGALLKDGQG